MSTLALVLQDPLAAQIRGAWDLLEERFGLDGVRKVPFPHVTLLAFDGLEHPAVQEILRELTHRTPPLRLRTAGLGLFRSPAPVVYASVPHTEPLAALQARLWAEVNRLGGRCPAFYTPDAWVPHLTLAQGHPATGTLEQVLELLAGQGLDAAFEIRNLTLFSWVGPRYEPCERYPLLGRALTPV